MLNICTGNIQLLEFFIVVVVLSKQLAKSNAQGDILNLNWISSLITWANKSILHHYMIFPLIWNLRWFEDSNSHSFFLFCFFSLMLADFSNQIPLCYATTLWLILDSTLVMFLLSHPSPIYPVQIRHKEKPKSTVTFYLLSESLSWSTISRFLSINPFLLN